MELDGTKGPITKCKGDIANPKGFIAAYKQGIQDNGYIYEPAHGHKRPSRRYHPSMMP
jgi:hypothetical protein